MSKMKILVIVAVIVVISVAGVVIHHMMTDGMM